MKRQGGGHIIGIASGSSIRGYKEETTYCASKHAQEGFIKALALEALPHHIAINSMGPGKPIKPTRMTWEELAQTPEEVKANWLDPSELGKAFVWLASQTPERFSGFRFDAGPIIDTIASEGFDFSFAPEKVTMYPEDFLERERWYHSYPD
jgi:NAD(P)-dependent dehydrogenase (short-subunit alcohol dehydrogenase family)